MLSRIMYQIQRLERGQILVVMLPCLHLELCQHNMIYQAYRLLQD